MLPEKKKTSKHGASRLNCYPYKKGTRWAVFHNGEDHEFKTFELANAYTSQLLVDELRSRPTFNDAVPAQCTLSKTPDVVGVKT